MNENYQEEHVVHESSTNSESPTSTTEPVENHSTSTSLLENTEVYEGNIDATIIGVQTREDEESGKHTVYEIRVFDKSTCQESFVFRRYSEFCKLYDELAQKNPEIIQEYTLPPTSWFYTFHEDTIRLRREKFNDFLYLILSKQKYAESNEVKQFLTYDLPMLQKALSFFRAKLYAYRQNKDFEMTDEKKEGMERSQNMVKLLNRTVRSESFRKAHDASLVVHSPVEERQDETVIHMNNV
jgi:hypothetical protein